MSEWEASGGGKVLRIFIRELRKHPLRGRDANLNSQQINFKRFSSLSRVCERCFFAEGMRSKEFEMVYVLMALLLLLISFVDFQFHGKVLVTWEKRSSTSFHCFQVLKIVSWLDWAAERTCWRMSGACLWGEIVFSPPYTIVIALRSASNGIFQFNVPEEAPRHLIKFCLLASAD